MLILGMILRITGFTQEELANYIGVSRASINSWLTDDKNMSENSKRMICEKFQIPYSFFQADLNKDLDYYKLVFSTIYENWKRINTTSNENSNVQRVNDIINQVVSDMNHVSYEKTNELEILDGLANGYNPFTGEVFEEDHILNNKDVKETLQKMYKHYTNGSFELTKEDLDEDQLALFEELRKWRRDKYQKEGYYHAYIVFTDKELINIITAEINKVEDLLNVRGIGDRKYEKYADELYEIIKTGKYNAKEESMDEFLDDAIEIDDDFLS